MALLSLKQPMTAQVAIAKVTAGGNSRREDTAHRSISDPSSTRHSNTLRLRSAPVGSGGVQTGGDFVTSNLKAGVTVEVSLTSRVNVSHSDSTPLRREREWAGEEERLVVKGKNAMIGLLQASVVNLHLICCTAYHLTFSDHCLIG